MVSIELNDIQGMIVKGYGRMHFSRYLMLKVTDESLAKAWIDSIIPHITMADDVVSNNCLNIAFTSKGLEVLGLLPENISNFSLEFREPIYTEHRSRLLGDLGSSAPENWRWGGPSNEEVHILLLVFGATEQMTNSYYNNLAKEFSVSGLQEFGHLEGKTLLENKEHFGFRDGIGQPIIKGAGRSGDAFNTVASGEFIMGYENEYGVFPDTPIVSVEQGNINLLPPDCRGTGFKDIGRNGSYMVLRQMEQHVDAFWTFMDEKTKQADGTIDTTASIRLASKMIGRWPDGTPLTTVRDNDPVKASEDDSFGYSNDKEGLGCPFGAHIRRINPRDTFEANGSKQSLKITKHHRIIRRGRQYGRPFNASTDNHKAEGEVGLLFLCFNTNIGNQFEFLAYTWGNYPGVKELYNDPDPIIGVREIAMEGFQQNFTIQDIPVSQSIEGLKRFVQIRGGAYFFFPSLTAIRWLTTV